MTFPFKLIAKGLKDLHPQGVSLKLEQDTGMSLVEAGEQGAPGQTGRIPVPGTLWHVGYANTDTVGLPLPILAGMAAGVVVLLVLALLWSYRRLQRDYQQDMGMTVTLVDATLKRLGATVQQPRLKESIPAIEMLTRYAQATRTASMNAERNENAVEQPQQFSQGIPRQQIQDHEACSMAPEKLPETLFQANLIRGLSDAELNAETAQAIGLVVGSMVQEAGAASHGERSEGW
ncbi:hypothetical protein [Thiolapillus sp.]|uniref:hypothetical protein n=1 Tax=Thiolapillus sp. TaxID=2017437 RepID=UPI003AF8B84A